MNPYDDDQRGGSDRRPSRHNEWDEPEYPEERPTASGRASVGRASVGRASVSPPGPESYDPVDPYGPTYEPYAQSRDPYSGGGRHGDAGYGDGAYDDGYDPPAPPAGRGVVGRASVRPGLPPSSQPGEAGRHRSPARPGTAADLAMARQAFLRDDRAPLPMDRS